MVPTASEQEQAQIKADLEAKNSIALNALKENLNKYKDIYVKTLIDSGASEELAKQMSKDLEDAIGSDNVAASTKILASILAGEISQYGGIALGKIVNFDNIDLDKLDELKDKLSFIESFSAITTTIDISTIGQEEIDSLYSAATRIHALETPITKQVVFDTIGYDLMGEELNGFLKLDDKTRKDLLLVYTTTYQTKVLAAQEQYAGGEGGANKAVLQAIEQAEVDAAKAFKTEYNKAIDTQGDDPNEDKGGSKTQTLKEYVEEFIKFTKEKQKYLQVTMEIIGTSKMEAILLIDQVRYLEAIAMTESKTSKIRKEGKRILDELTKSAEKRLIADRAFAYLSMSSEEKTIASLNSQTKALEQNAENENKVIRVKQRQLALNNRGLEELSEKEDSINKVYDERFKALDKVANTNDRILSQDESRLSLATALASGDIAAAASAANDMQYKSAQYQLEDTRAALEEKMQSEIKSLAISINNEMLTREQILGRNKTLNEQIEVVEDRLYIIEEQRLKLADARAATELRIYLLQQKQTIEAIRAQKNLTSAQKEMLKSLMADFKNVSGVDHNQYRQYGGKMMKMAYGGVAYKGSNESPPTLKMAYGSTVPGVGMTDKVPAMLTPGEFVIRKSVAKNNMPFLEALNNQAFPGIGSGSKVPTNNFLDGMGSPRYSIPERGSSSIPVNNSSVVATSSPMYNNTYSVNVNVSGTNASPDEIANVVMAKLSNQTRGNLRSYNY